MTGRRNLMCGPGMCTRWIRQYRMLSTMAMMSQGQRISARITLYMRAIATVTVATMTIAIIAIVTVTTMVTNRVMQNPRAV